MLSGKLARVNTQNVTRQNWRSWCEAAAYNREH